VFVFVSAAVSQEVNASRPECRKIAATWGDKDLSENAMSFRINLGQESHEEATYVGASLHGSRIMRTFCRF